MRTQDFTTTFNVDRTPQQVFDAISDVRGWWSGEVEGGTEKLGDEFTYRVEGAHYSKQRITETIPGKKIVWHVLEARLGFVKDESEWQGTDIVFEITKKGDKTELRFTHHGLIPDYECYDVCSDAWGSYIRGSLRNLITTGKGAPNPKE
jgi:hypothetical protein